MGCFPGALFVDQAKLMAVRKELELAAASGLQISSGECDATKVVSMIKSKARVPT